MQSSDHKYFDKPTFMINQTEDFFTLTCKGMYRYVSIAILTWYRSLPVEVFTLVKSLASMSCKILYFPVL